MSARTRWILLAGSIAALGCAQGWQTPEMTHTEIDLAIERLGSEMLDDLVEMRSRLVDLEYRLTKAAAGMCNLTLPLPGVLVTRKGAFHHEGIRAVVGDRLSATEDLTVVHVVPNGPFSSAGIQVGDRILTIDGETLRTAEEFGQFLFDLEGSRPVRVRFARPGVGERQVAVYLQRTCPVRLSLAGRSVLVPWRRGLRVAVPIGLIKRAQDDDALAVAVAHEIAHALFDQPDDDEFEAEARADRMGLRIAASAGYDISGAAKYWEDVATEYPWLALPSRRGGRPRAGRWREEWRAYDLFPHHDIARRLEGIRQGARAGR